MYFLFFWYGIVVSYCSIGGVLEVLQDINLYVAILLHLKSCWIFSLSYCSVGFLCEVFLKLHMTEGIVSNLTASLLAKK